MSKFYFTKEEAQIFQFCMVPLELIENPIYSKLSSDAKLLYGLLLNRNSLSIKNDWSDSQGRIFIYFSRQEAMEKFHFSDKSASKVFKELISFDLIEEKRQGLGKPNIIYVKKFYGRSESIDKTSEDQSRKNYESESELNTKQEAKDLRPNYIDISYTDIKHTQSKNVCGNKPNKLNKPEDDDFIELSKKVNKTIDESFGQDELKKLRNKYGAERIKRVLADWHKLKENVTTTATGYFNICVKNDIKQTNKSYAKNKNETMYNFQQRNYDDEEYEKHYTKIE